MSTSSRYCRNWTGVGAVRHLRRLAHRGGARHQRADLVDCFDLRKTAGHLGHSGVWSVGQPSKRPGHNPESHVRVIGRVVLVGKAFEYGQHLGAVIWGHVDQCGADWRVRVRQVRAGQAVEAGEVARAGGVIGRFRGRRRHPVRSDRSRRVDGVSGRRHSGHRRLTCRPGRLPTFRVLLDVAV